MKNPSLSADADKIMLYIIGGVTVFLVAVIGIFSVASGQQITTNSPIASYSIKDTDRPKAKVDSTFSDLGTMKVNDEKKAQFTIENIGTKPLILSNVSSSCGCTVGQITINGNTSSEFGMHSRSTWQGTVDPGEKATVTVIYRPYIMPVSGVVTRDVYVKTNDPENGQLTFTVKAKVE